MEQVRNRVNVRLIADPHKAAKALSKPNFCQSQIINEDLIMVKCGRQRMFLNKPIFAGFAVLELSKLLMYQFHYDYIVKTYEDRATLLFTDTDSLTYHIQTEDLYADMKKTWTCSTLQTLSLPIPCTERNTRRWWESSKSRQARWPRYSTWVFVLNCIVYLSKRTMMPERRKRKVRSRASRSHMCESICDISDFWRHLKAKGRGMTLLDFNVFELKNMF